jgi:SET domain-containing protein
MNHCKHPNTCVSNKYKQKCKVAYAIKNIKKGDELTFYYQCSIPLWFEVK